MPPPAPPPALARWRQVAESSTLFLSLLTFLLLCELGLETYGRGYVDDAQNEQCGAGRANSIACAATLLSESAPARRAAAHPRRATWQIVDVDVRSDRIALARREHHDAAAPARRDADAPRGRKELRGAVSP